MLSPQPALTKRAFRFPTRRLRRSVRAVISGLTCLFVHYLSALEPSAPKPFWCLDLETSDRLSLDHLSVKELMVSVTHGLPSERPLSRAHDLIPFLAPPNCKSHQAIDGRTQ
jgi:hypothetical protein